MGLISEGLSAIKSIDKLVSNIFGFFKKRSKKKQENKDYEARHATESYKDKYYNKHNK